MVGLSKEGLSYSDIEFNPKGDIFSFFRNYLTQKDILDGKIDVLVDKREPAKYGIKLKNLGYNVEYRTLEIGDYVFEGGIAFERKKFDFLNFKDVLQKAMELKKIYRYPYLIVEGDIRNISFQKGFYGKPNYSLGAQMSGLISSLVVRGMTPIFCSDFDHFFQIMEGIVKKHLDGKDRENDYKIEGFRIANGPDYTRAMYANLPNVGPKTADSLYEKYRTISELIKAKIDDLQEIDGIGKKTAEEIFKILHKGD